MTDTDNREELKEIAVYVREQRLETDLANVQGYGIDQGARSVRFSLASVAAVGNDVAALKNSVKANTEKIGTHTQQILDLGNSISGLGELPERNRRDIETLGDAMREYGERLTRDEGSIRINAGTIESVSREVGRVSERFAGVDERLEIAEQEIVEIKNKTLQATRIVYDLDEYTAYPGEIVQYGGEGGTHDHGGFYEWNGTEWVRLSVDDHTALEQKVKTNTDAITTLNGGEQTNGSVKNTVLDYIGKAQHARFKVVQTLPPVSEAESNVMYLVPFEGKEGVYKQYILADGRFVQLDNTEVDLSDYYTKHETDTAISDVADALTAKDKEQDGRLTNLEKHKQVNSDWNATSGVAQILNKPNLAKVATSGSYNDLTDKPTISTDYVQYHASLTDADTSKPAVDASGHIWKYTEGFNVLITKNTYYVDRRNKEEVFGLHQSVYMEITESNLNITVYLTENTFDNYIGVSKGSLQVGDALFRYGGKDAGRAEEVVSFENGTITLANGEIIKDRKTTSYIATICADYNDIESQWGYINSSWLVCWRNERWECVYVGGGAEDLFYPSFASQDIIIGGSGEWQDVYDTSTITADISAEVQRATQAEQALSTRIDGKADASTWSASLKQQIDSDHTTLSGLSSKWTDILKSQIDADHTTLGTLSGYLTSAKRTSIDNAISLAHAQNTDTQLASGLVEVRATQTYIERGIYTNSVTSVGDIYSNGNKHRLSNKLNSNMQQTFDNIEDLIADMSNIPEGAWCAIIDTHSAGVSAQSDDDIIE